MNDLRGENILITGGAGFIGTKLQKELAAARHVAIVDNLHPQVHGHQPMSVDVAMNATFHRGDIADPKTWCEVLTGFTPTVLIHLAAETGTGQSLTESARHSHTNVHGTAVMIDALHRANAFPKQVLLTSSRAVYGEGEWAEPSGRTFSAQPRDAVALENARWAPVGPNGQEGMPMPNSAAQVNPRPTNIYAATKLAQENILSSWCWSFEVPLSILRLQNVYGAGQSLDNAYTGVLTYFARQAVNGETVEVYEDGGIIRDFVHVADVVQAILCALSTPPPAAKPRTLDIGSGAHGTLFAYATQLAMAAGSPPPATSRRYRAGDVRSAFAEVESARKEIGYKPTVPFQEGLADLMEWAHQGASK